MRSFLGWMGMGDEQVRKLDFEVWRERERLKSDSTLAVKQIVPLNFAKGSLPAGARNVMDWLEEGCTDPEFVNAMVYLDSRGNDILTGYDYYWTPSKDHGLNNRVIIPFRWKDDIVGWTGRSTIDGQSRYFDSAPSHFLFNTKVADTDWEYLFLVEGPFDAIAINGIAALGGTLTEEQTQWLRHCGKRIIVVPDMEKQGGGLVDTALKEGWSVSFPKWDIGIKDAADAVKRYGKIYTVWSIIDASVSNKLEINVRRQRLR
jgi:hypothetical protein